MNMAEKDNTWLLDSGATHHACNKREWFRSINNVAAEPIMTANGCITAKGIGDIEIRAFTRGKTKEITIKDVLYIPEIKRNLLSVSKIEEKERRVEFANFIF